MSKKDGDYKPQGRRRRRRRTRLSPLKNQGSVYTKLG
jgi:hypothetical protein